MSHASIALFSPRIDKRLTQLRQQQGRAFDVGEKEGDGANGQFIQLVWNRSSSAQVKNTFL